VRVHRVTLRVAIVLALALAVLNHVGRRAPYYFLDPGTVATAAVIMNICALAGGVLALGYSLLVVNRAVATMSWRDMRTRAPTCGYRGFGGDELRSKCADRPSQRNSDCA
jgi:hypothetical protein